MPKSQEQLTNHHLSLKVKEMQLKIITIIEGYRKLQQTTLEKDRQISKLQTQNNRLHQQLQLINNRTIQQRENQKSSYLPERTKQNSFDAQYLRSKQQGKQNQLEQMRKRYDLKNSHYPHSNQNEKSVLTYYGSDKGNNVGSRIKIENYVPSDYKRQRNTTNETKLNQSKSANALHLEDILGKHQPKGDSQISNEAIKNSPHPPAITHSHLTIKNKPTMNPNRCTKYQRTSRFSNPDSHYPHNQEEILTFLNQTSKAQTSKNNSVTSNAHEPEAAVLRKLWEERDREIKKMDDMFQNINKRLSTIQ